MINDDKEQLINTIASIAYLYSKNRLQNTYFFEQSKLDLEYLLGILKEHNYKDYKGDFVKLDYLIDKLDADGYLPEDILPKR